MPPQYDPASGRASVGVASGSSEATSRHTSRPSEQPYCIVIPPPNVTGRLHVGHALEHLQDIAGPPCTDAGLRDALAPRHGPRGHRDAGRRRARAPRRRASTGATSAARPSSSGCGPGRSSTAARSSSRSSAWAHSLDWSASGSRWTKGCPAPSARRSSAVRRGPDLPRRAAGQLVPDRSHRPVGLRGRARGRRGRAGHVPLSALGRDRVRSRSPPRGSRRCWATPAIAVHPGDERYAALVGKTVDASLRRARDPDRRRRRVDQEFGTGAVKVTPLTTPTTSTSRSAPACR